MDRNRVIKGLECCSDESCNCPDGCPYSAQGGRCFQLLAKDALTLLKEPEPAKRGAFYQDDDRDEWYTYPNHCVSCGQTWMGSTNYCPNGGIKLIEVIIMEEKDESGRCD